MPDLIVHVNVTRHPMAEWVARQVPKAFPGDGWGPRFLQRDRGGAYGWAFRRRIKAMGIEELVSAPRSRWQNAYVERFIGSIRRECTDHIIPMGEAHLLTTVREYVEYDNNDRPHQSLEGDAPTLRAVEDVGEVAAMPILGRLHHRYSRVAYAESSYYPWGRCSLATTMTPKVSTNCSQVAAPGWRTVFLAGTGRSRVKPAAVHPAARPAIFGLCAVPTPTWRRITPPRDVCPHGGFARPNMGRAFASQRSPLR